LWQLCRLKSSCDSTIEAASIPVTASHFAYGNSGKRDYTLTKGQGALPD